MFPVENTFQIGDILAIDDTSDSSSDSSEGSPMGLQSREIVDSSVDGSTQEFGEEDLWSVTDDQIKHAIVKIDFSDVSELNPQPSTQNVLADMFQ